ncbi:DUF1765-domain-containing protein [Macroventuria anomochaeta]|uniref:DUF1765-domain-containing protein n=1 Tax=Macroventuria anomochaeta TaxID=301207 RepID=A0ACB6SIK2_9PLEO|nr:DUF1765-domain-containing protein [Macroventuria anomochaeta]KAF2633843.1 DUF1765-domain-containing protein [Macroventuria anomochaeta]
MPIAVASALRGQDVFSSKSRGRSRAASEVGPLPPTDGEKKPERAQLPKAASYTYFPRVKSLDGDAPAHDSEEDLKKGKDVEVTSDSSSGGSSPSSEEAPQALEMPQLRPAATTRRSSRFLPFSSKSREPSIEPKPERHRKAAVKETESPGGSPSRSLTKLRRKSWVVSQQQQQQQQPTTASPTKESKKEKKAAQKEESAKKKATNTEAPKRKTPASTDSIPEEAEAKNEARDEAEDTVDHRPAPIPLSKKNKRLSALLTANGPAVPSVPKSFSTEQLPLYPHSDSPLSPTNVVPPLPRNISTDKLGNKVKTEPRKKDELWTVFRTLEGELRKFQHKSSSLKANIVRTSLLQDFIYKYANHPSNQKLRPEDLDRRTNILNGWWTGLLELVAGRNNQSISGTDRPVILEGLAGIMERPEWRLAPSPFCALADREEPGSALTATSATSSSSDFLAESVYHNVKNTFQQNLMSQMAFVVDKMTPRNAAASLVTFCGKTCAYAFCFCPGVADILVRLWSPSLEMMKRVLEEAGVSRLDKMDAISDRISAAFPPNLYPLKFQSLAKMVRVLRNPPAATPPLQIANLDWYGLWMKRWSGAESDLFYVFVKHYHILVTGFLPSAPTAQERVCAPGLLMVHAQILVNMDATINRHALLQQPEDNGAQSITFDDVLSDPDASASTMAIPPANATRQMQENRLIMLIRDFLSEGNSHIHIARHMFADSFASLLQAQARKISVYDSNACYTLCDFLEEAFAILVRYEQHNSEHHVVLNWSFWLTVCREMTVSENTATEIKLYSFLYSIWSTLVLDEQRKRSLCLEFLLEPAFFESRFNHWCPMVRSYYMRLICWRVARFDGEPSEVEVEVKTALSERLRSVWSHYLWLAEDAERLQLAFPSTQACNPAPGRRFLIIRNDNPIAASNGPFLTFDGVVQNPHQRKPSASTPVPEPMVQKVAALTTDSMDFPDEEPTKGKWGMLKSLMGGSSKPSKSKTSAKDKENAKTATPPNASLEKAPAEKPAPTPTPSPPPPAHRSYSFRFSLEWVDKRFGTYQNMRLQPPRLPLPAQVLLQQKGIHIDAVSSIQPTGKAATSSRYAGRALAEWTFVSHECQNFFDRRKNEGVPTNKQVETPSLCVEAFRRPG